MIVTRKAIPRRTVLRGLGATLALPLLDGMVPAFARAASVAAPLRFGAIYVPNGMIMKNFTPVAEGVGFEITPILEPVAPFRDRLLVLSGLTNREAYPLPGEGSGDHSRAAASFLTGVHAKKTEGPDMRAGISIDQILAKETAQHTQLASLELALDSKEMVGACDPGYACAYSHTISWRTPTTPMPMENDPRALFERLFGSNGTTDPAKRLARTQKDRSILDFVNEQAGSLRRRLGADDGNKLTEYFEAVRDIERRIQKAEEQGARQLPLVEQPAGIPPTFEEHAKVMFDLLVLALQSDLTRVFTFMLAREVSSRSYPEIGVPEGHHPLTHNALDAHPIAQVTKINAYHMNMFAYFLDKLRSTRDGDGSLLDHSMVIYGSGISNGNTHAHENLPIVLAGGGGQIKSGRHLRYAKDTPLANVYLNVVDKFGLPVEHFGDSTGRAEGLSDI